MNSFNGSMTDEECFQAEMLGGIHLDNSQFVNLYEITASSILQLLGKIETFTDCGGGVGAYSLAMKKRDCNVIYYDLNPFHISYAAKHDAAHTIKQWDFTKATITSDLCALIEVAEHIPDGDLSRFFDNLYCKYLHFSSTPHKAETDEAWGHINIKEPESWIKFISTYGFVLKKRINLPTSWSLIFELSDIEKIAYRQAKLFCPYESAMDDFIQGFKHGAKYASTDRF